MVAIDLTAEEDKNVVHTARNLINIFKLWFDTLTSPCQTICVAYGVKTGNIHTSYI